ncbi:MAG: 3'-5' exonuclease domain-containing protein 2 [Dysgonamonadaceae bacterium]|nr:3'-5' exonuclease domain-containing protein 2 [Dysgonamonadaceae bacterium]
MEKTITKEEIAGLPVALFPGRIKVVQTVEEADRAVANLMQYQRLGFDTETRPSFTKGVTKGVALIQLSTDKVCYLFRLHAMGFPPALIQLLSDPNILKIGLSLKDDFQSMSRRLKFKPSGFVDLQKIVQSHNIGELSLQKIYAILFRQKISKAQRLTNWEAPELTESQKRYAALDAWACLKIYETLCPAQKSI